MSSNVVRFLHSSCTNKMLTVKSDKLYMCLIIPRETNKFKNYKKNPQIRQIVQNKSNPQEREKQKSEMGNKEMKYRRNKQKTSNIMADLNPKISRITLNI